MQIRSTARGGSTHAMTSCTRQSTSALKDLFSLPHRPHTFRGVAALWSSKVVSLPRLTRKTHGTVRTAWWLAYKPPCKSQTRPKQIVATQPYVWWPNTVAVRAISHAPHGPTLRASTNLTPRQKKRVISVPKGLVALEKCRRNDMYDSCPTTCRMVSAPSSSRTNRAPKLVQAGGGGCYTSTHTYGHVTTIYK